MLDPFSKARSGIRWTYDQISGEISNLWAISAAPVPEPTPEPPPEPTPEPTALPEETDDGAVVPPAQASGD